MGQLLAGLLTVGVAIVVGAVGSVASAYYRHRSVVALIEAWKLDRALDLPVALRAIRPRRMPSGRPSGRTDD